MFLGVKNGKLIQFLTLYICELLRLLYIASFFLQIQSYGLLKSMHCRCSARSIFVAIHIDSMIFLQK